MPSSDDPIPPPPPPIPWTVPEAQAALGEMAFQLLAMADTMKRINAALVLLQPPEPLLTAMLEDEICPNLAVEVSGCVECVICDYLPQVVETLLRAADVSVEQLEQDFLDRKRRYGR